MQTVIRKYQIIALKCFKVEKFIENWEWIIHFMLLLLSGNREISCGF